MAILTKRYIRLSGYAYEGGYDFDGAFDTLEEAIPDQTDYENTWADIIDLTTYRIVWQDRKHKS